MRLFMLCAQNCNAHFSERDCSEVIQVCYHMVPPFLHICMLPLVEGMFLIIIN